MSSNDRIKLVFKEMIKETSDVYSFIFEIPDDFNWVAGQHGIFRFENRELKEEKDFRIFSFASIKEEGMMLFSTRIVENPSEFKQNLLKLEAGEVMTIDSAMGKFVLKEYKRPICIMAGGIGITPIRSFLKQMDIIGENPKYIEALYSDDRGEYAYENFFQEINRKYSSVEIVFISDRNEFSKKIEEFVNNNGNEGLYYISGTPGMVKALSNNLKDMGIEKENIKTDYFMGY